MNLIACDSCGVVLDKDKAGFPEPFDLEDVDGCIDTDKAAWDGENYVPKIKCPACERDILDTK